MPRTTSVTTPQARAGLPEDEVRASAPKGQAAVGSQTLSRGIRILEVLAEAGGPLAIDEVAAQLGVHRSVAYRLIRTLEAHGLVQRGASGRLSLGVGLAALASRVEVDLRAIVVPELTRASEDLGLTCFAALREDAECVTFASVEPPRAVAVVAQRPGTRHSLTRGASGRAVLAALSDDLWPVDSESGIGSEDLKHEVERVRGRGWAESTDEVIPGLGAVAVPLALPDGRAASVAALFVGPPVGAGGIAERLHEVVAGVRHALGESEPGYLLTLPGSYTIRNQRL